MTLQEMRQKFAANETEYSAILAKGDGVTAEEQQSAADLIAANEALQASISAAPSSADLALRASALRVFGDQSAAPMTHRGDTSADMRTQRALATLPATATRSRVKSFKSEDGMTKEFKAYAFAQMLRATCLGRADAQKWCREHVEGFAGTDRGGNVVNLAHTEIVNTAGGFLVPPQWENDLIDLREIYGDIRGLLRNRAMGSDTLTINRRTGGLTAYFVNDAVAITESTKGWDQVNLVAKKVGILAKISSELNEDAMINVADDLAGEIAYAFAVLEDDCGFNGDGTSTYGGMTGLRSALLNLSATRANIAGLYVGTGNQWTELTLADFNLVASRLPKYASLGAVWAMSKAFWHAVPERLMLAAGGITTQMIAAGAPPMLLGYPVRICQKMPVVEANDQVCALLGDFAKAADFGDRRATTIAVSEHSSFANDVLDIRGTERFDVLVHDVGNASGTASLRVPGPVVGLLTAAS